MGAETLLTVSEAAEVLKLSRAMVYRLARENRIPVCRINSSVRVPQNRLLAWIDERADEAAAEAMGWQA